MGIRGAMELKEPLVTVGVRSCRSRAKGRRRGEEKWLREVKGQRRMQTLLRRLVAALLSVPVRWCCCWRLSRLVGEPADGGLKPAVRHC